MSKVIEVLGQIKGMSEALGEFSDEETFLVEGLLKEIMSNMDKVYRKARKANVEKLRKGEKVSVTYGDTTYTISKVVSEKPQYDMDSVWEILKSEAGLDKSDFIVGYKPTSYTTVKISKSKK